MTVIKYVAYIVPYKLFHLIIFCGLLLITSSCDKSDTTPSLRVAHNSWPGYEALPLAESENLFKNVRVTNYRVASATEVIRAFEQDIVDVAAVTLDEAIVFQNRSKEAVYIIAVIDISHGADVIIATKEISSLRDLEGKRVGVEATALGAFFLTRAIESETTLTLSQLKVIPLLYGQHYSAFMANDVDAVVTFEPVKSKILQNKGHVIYDSTSIKNEIIDVLITKKNIVDNKKEELKELIRGYFKSHKFIKENPAKAYAKMADFEEVSIANFKKSLEGLRIPGKEENLMLLSGSTPALNISIDKLNAFLIRRKIINSGKEQPIFITDEFLPMSRGK